MWLVIAKLVRSEQCLKLSVWAPWWQCWGGTLYGENNLESRTERGEFFCFIFFWEGWVNLKFWIICRFYFPTQKLSGLLQLYVQSLAKMAKTFIKSSVNWCSDFVYQIKHFLSVDDRIDDHISFFYQIKHFLSVTSSDNDGNVGDLCLADQVPCSSHKKRQFTQNHCKIKCIIANAMSYPSQATLERNSRCERIV